MSKEDEDKKKPKASAKKAAATKKAKTNDKKSEKKKPSTEIAKPEDVSDDFDLENADVTLSQVGRKVVKLHYTFMKDDGTVKEFSPTKINERVGKIISNNKRKVGETVATLGSLLMGNQNQAMVVAFTAGWYNRKYFSELEKEHGPGEITFDQEPMTKERFKTIVKKNIMKAKERLAEMLKEIEEGSFIDEEWEDYSE